MRLNDICSWTEAWLLALWMEQMWRWRRRWAAITSSYLVWPLKRLKHSSTRGQLSKVLVVLGLSSIEVEDRFKLLWKRHFWRKTILFSLFFARVFLPDVSLLFNVRQFFWQLQPAWILREKCRIEAVPWSDRWRLLLTPRTALVPRSCIWPYQSWQVKIWWFSLCLSFSVFHVFYRTTALWNSNWQKNQREFNLAKIWSFEETDIFSPTNCYSRQCSMFSFKFDDISIY